VSAQPGSADGTTDAAIDSESDTDLSELSDDDVSLGSLNSEDSESDFHSMTPAEQAEHETFGIEYEGPCLSNEHASRLLILMSHASTCPCHHRSQQHLEICKSTKYMMLHVRDCPGTTATMDVCPFPWCRKVKHLLYHLVSCREPNVCPICSHDGVPRNMKDLVGLNSYRMKKHREKMIAAAKASRAAINSKASSGTKQPANGACTSGPKTVAPRKLVPATSAQSTPVPPPKGGQGTTTVKKRVSAVSKPTAAIAASNGQKQSTQTQKPTPTHAQTNRVQVKVEDTSPPPVSTSIANTPHMNENTPAAATSVPDPTMANSGSAAATEHSAFADGTVSTHEDEDDVLPTPIYAMKMEDDHDDENVEVSELLAAGADDEPTEVAMSPTDSNVNAPVAVSEASTSNASETSPGRSSSETPSSAANSLSGTAADTNAPPATTISALSGNTSCAVTSSTTTPSEAVASSSPTTATSPSDVEKTVGSVKVN
jgi:TAZ zinc finger